MEAKHKILGHMLKHNLGCSLRLSLPLKTKLIRCLVAAQIKKANPLTTYSQGYRREEEQKTRKEWEGWVLGSS